MEENKFGPFTTNADGSVIYDRKNNYAVADVLFEDLENIIKTARKLRGKVCIDCGGKLIKYTHAFLRKDGSLGGVYRCNKCKREINWITNKDGITL